MIPATEQACTIKENVVARFARDILSGRLQAGDRLPGEREIAEEMNVSRSVVHLAIEQMASMKLIEMRPRVGNFVCDYRKNGNFATMMMIARYGDSAMDMDMTYALVELRNTIEGAAMRQLAENGTSEDFSFLRKLNEELRIRISETDDLTELAEYSRRFHLEIVRRCGNPFYNMILNSFSEIYLPWIKCIEHWTPMGIYEQNERISDLLELGKGDEAASYISEIFERYKAENPDEAF